MASKQTGERGSKVQMAQPKEVPIQSVGEGAVITECTPLEIADYYWIDGVHCVLRFNGSSEVFAFKDFKIIRGVIE